MYLEKQIFSLGSFPEVDQKQKTEREKERKKNRKLVIRMASYALQTPPRVAHAKPPGPKYWGKQNFSLGSFPKVGQKQYT